eukprot:scaffold3150_cov51-Attheya_sp.AAC.13
MPTPQTFAALSMVRGAGLVLGNIYLQMFQNNKTARVMKRKYSKMPILERSLGVIVNDPCTDIIDTHVQVNVPKVKSHTGMYQVIESEQCDIKTHTGIADASRS